MKTKPFHPNHFGLYYVYNGANKRYTHAPFEPMPPDARLTSSHFGNAVAQVEDLASYRPKARKAA